MPASGLLDPGYLQDVFAPWAPVAVRKMFGGQGVYRDGRMFALVAEGVIYLKVDDKTLAAFAEAELEPFVYSPPSGRTMTMSYRRMPEACFEDQEALKVWANRAYAAATRTPPPNRRNGVKRPSR